MIKVTSVLGKLADSSAEKTVVPVPYEWFECERGHLHRVAADGTELGVTVSGGVEDGDILYETDSHRYVVQLSETELISVAIRSIEEAARVGFELGNRHLSMKILSDRILVPYEGPTCEYLSHLGFEVSCTTGKLSDFIICRAHGHSHTHEHAHSHQDHG